MILTYTDIVIFAYDNENDVDDVLNETELNMLELSSRGSVTDFKSIDDVLFDVYSNIEELMKSDVEVTGLSTGYRDLDRITSGFQKNDLIIIAARPSMGKTAFALNKIGRAHV